jgi:molecular chaperone DnaK
MAIGIALPGGRFKAILDRNTALPATKRYVIATRRDDQRELELNVFQGDSERVAENEYLGTLRLGGLPKGPRGTVQIEVIFEVSNESLLKVSAKELTTKKEVSATLFTRDTPAAVRSRLATLSDPNLKAVHPPTPLPTAGVNGTAVAAPALSETPVAPPETPSPAAIAQTRSGGFFSWFKRLFARG